MQEHCFGGLSEKKEKIMAKLDVRPGHANDTKTYSDGSIEQEILQAVSEGKEIDWYDDKRWPILCYFSPLRSNIFNWYPFRDGASVLEIGAGCGSLTGYLCERVAHVTAVDKSLIRSEINLKRHADNENLEIVVDDFATMTLAEKYDYVVVIGVLEYAAWTFPGEDPADAFLRKAASFLKEDGRMLVAIENRLGHKYLSGAREDHTGHFFSGINNYAGESVRTFSRSELTAKVEGAGLHVNRFFYPYPDYKFPEEIFTDASVNERYPISTDYRLDTARVSIFSVKDFYQGLMGDGIAGNFANSFLVEITKDELQTPTPYQYVKISNDRKREHAICTIITDDNQVLKQPLYPCGEAHIRSIAALGGHAYTDALRNIRCTLLSNCNATFPYVEGASLQSRLTAAPHETREDLILQWFTWLKNELFSAGSVHPQNADSEAFRQVFGDAICKDDLHWVPCGNIDMIPSNIFGEIGNVTLIDYEWQMTFPVPAEFSLWRFLLSLMNDTGLLSTDYASDEKLTALLSCSAEALRCFEKWVYTFTNEYIGMKSMVALSQPVYPLDFDDALRTQRLAEEQQAALSQAYDANSALTQANQQLADALAAAKQEIADARQTINDLTGELQLIQESCTEKSTQPCRRAFNEEAKGDNQMNTNPIVTVVMPCYNDGCYIQESVAAVKAQTYPEIELIIVDDGSNDSKTLVTLAELQKESGITVLHADHAGVSSARNTGIAAAKGKYILPLDSDDTIDPTYIDKAVKVLETRDDIGVVYCQADLFGAQTGRWDLPDYSREAMLLDNIVFVTSLFPKALWQDAGGFNTNMKDGMEDYDFWLSVLETGKEIYQIPEVLFHYRIKDISRTTQFQKDPSSIKATYHQLMDNHRQFMLDNADVIIPQLRDALIDQLYLRRVAEQQVQTYQQQAQIIEKVRQTPVISKVLRKIYHLFVK